MHRAAFQLNKVRRCIRTQGQPFQFVTPKKNEFGEPNGETESHIILGVFHETTSYVSAETTEASTTRKKSSPMVLMLWESVGALQHADKLCFNNKSYRVVEVKNLAEANLIADVSLEEVQT